MNLVQRPNLKKKNPKNNVRTQRNRFKFLIMQPHKVKVIYDSDYSIGSFMAELRGGGEGKMFEGEVGKNKQNGAELR